MQRARWCALVLHAPLAASPIVRSPGGAPPPSLLFGRRSQPGPVPGSFLCAAEKALPWRPFSCPPRKPSMDPIAFDLRGDHITLDALLKAAGLASSGGEAKMLIR